MRAAHADDFRRFHISHDNYYSTHSPENEHYATLIYRRLADKGLIFTREVEQLYDPERGLFLADRHVRGTCPRCGAAEQPGDNCDACGATYDATELGEPRSLLSDAAPVRKASLHYFFDLAQFTDYLKEWTATDAVQPEVTNKLAEWLGDGLKPWDISRDAPYFGFRIPDTEGKYFYVWMDAPIGYIASFRNYCDRTDGLAFEEFWDPGSGAEVHHFIGKDIVNFHALFWPSVLSGAGFRTPTKVRTHGFITVGGTRMSQVARHLHQRRHLSRPPRPRVPALLLRHKLVPNTDDVDVNLDDFVQRVNSDLVGKVVNIASRCAGFIARQFDGKLAAAFTTRSCGARSAGRPAG